MALPNFLDKAALSASQVLKDYDRHGFEEVLNTETIGIVFGGNATTTISGRAGLDLLVRLLTRLYPSLTFINAGGSEDVFEELVKLAQSINPEVTLDKQPTVYVVLGETSFDTQDKQVFYIGSKGWRSFFSVKNPQAFDEDENMIGAGCAACFAAANLFRHVFQKSLPHSQTDDDFTFCALHFAKNCQQSECAASSTPNHWTIETLHLVGVGAIGNAVIWTLRQLAGLTGKVHLIDKEQIELSNLQRYTLTDQDSINTHKVNFAKEYLKESKIKTICHKATWQEFISNRKNRNLHKVAVCVDSKIDRMAVQTALPKHIYNAWTQPESLGVSRHYDFVNKACLSCLYLPTIEEKSRSQEVADNLGVSNLERLVRDYLALSKPFDVVLLNHICHANDIEPSSLEKYIGQPLEAFYSQVVCGGIMLQHGIQSTGTTDSVMVPLAFESSLAGILLISEVIAHSNQLRNEGEDFPNISTINLLRPLTESKYTNTSWNKSATDRCICQDDDYVDVFKEKWTIP